MSALPALVSVDEYLRTVYDPDCDYVDGVVLERNVGEREHGEWQFEVAVYLRNHRNEWNISVAIETRVQVAPTRFRVPDICLFVGPTPKEPIFTHPPFLCVEILSPEDRMSRMSVKIDDYLAFGVSYIWVIDPQTHRAWSYTRDGKREVVDGVLRTENPEIIVPLDALFA